jgi:hypothetical protein
LEDRSTDGRMGSKWTLGPLNNARMLRAPRADT